MGKIGQKSRWYCVRRKSSISGQRCLQSWPFILPAASYVVLYCQIVRVRKFGVNMLNNLIITESSEPKICVCVPIQPSFFIDSSTARVKSRTESLIHFQLYFAGFIPSGQPTWPPAFVNKSIMLPLPESTRA